MNGDGLRILDHLPQISKGAAALTPAEKELLKWVGVFLSANLRPGKFMMRHSHAHRRLGNSVPRHHHSPQIELARFHSRQPCPEIWEKLPGRGPAHAPRQASTKRSQYQ